ncbi:MAG: protein TolA, partial [Caldimonas sp.]
MTATALQHDAFAPRPPAGMRSSFGLAVAAHVLLVLALAWSVNWKASQPEGVVAELWSALPQIAAPRVVAPEPTPPVVEPRPVRATPPTPTPTPPRVEPAPPQREDAQIAIERAAREKQRRVDIERAELARTVEKKRRDELRRAQQLELAEQQKQRLADEQ